MLYQSYYKVFLPLLACLLLLSCSMDNSNPTGSSDNTVTIVDNAFQPSQLDVAVGRLVVWRHQGNVPHTVTSGTPTASPGARFDSGTIQSGGGFQFTFTSPGTYPYFCKIHGVMMSGVITVH